MYKELAQAQPKFDKLKKIARKSIIPAAIGAGVLFPAAVYADTAINDEVIPLSNRISNLSDNSTAQAVEAAVLAASLFATANSYYVGKRWDERKLHTLRVSGPALLFAAATSALADSQTTLNYAIPAGLTLASTYAIGATNIISTFERTRDINIRATAVASGTSIMTAGMTIFLAAADKL